jgi:UDP:flavonoid glycosyltransferase YjiC (YdhE family)
VWPGLDGPSPQWPDANGKRVFAYLKPFRGLARLLDHMEHSGASVVVFTRAELDAARWARGNLSIVREPLGMGAVAEQADLLVCHAGHGTIATALLAGIPLLLLPFQVEQYHNGKNVERLGAGMSLKVDDMQLAAEAFSQLLDDPAFTAGAAAFANRYRDFSAAQALQSATQHLLELAR